MSRNEEEMSLLIKGDEYFISKIYRETYPSIAKFIKKNSGNEADAEDIFQDALSTIYLKAKKGDLALDCPLKNFLLAVGRNMWLYRLRGRKRLDYKPDLLILSLKSDLDLEKMTEQAEFHALYFKHFDQLSDDCKEVLKLYFLNDSMEDIARQMNYKSGGYARKKKFKCKERLIAKIKGDPIYGELTEKN